MMLSMPSALQTRRASIWGGLWHHHIGIAENHLPAFILDEMTDEILVQKDIKCLRRALLLFCRRGRDQRQLDSQRLQSRERFSDLAGLFALLKIDDKAQSGPRGQREIFLSDIQAFARLPDQGTDLSWGIARVVLDNYHTGTYWALSGRSIHNTPARECCASASTTCEVG
jgi:hypothetical protein